jgi:hypothetical protein
VPFNRIKLSRFSEYLVYQADKVLMIMTSSKVPCRILRTLPRNRVGQIRLFILAEARNTTGRGSEALK